MLNVRLEKSLKKKIISLIILIMLFPLGVKAVDEIETCVKDDVSYIQECACIPAAVADVTSFVYKGLKIAGPVLLIIIGSFNLGKAIVATDEKGIEKAKKNLVNKFIAAAAIFLVFSIIQMAISIVSDRTEELTGNGSCLNILLNGYEV